MAKLPNKIQDIVNKKQDFIDSNRNKLEASVIRMQEKLLNELIEKIIPELDVKDGQILSTSKNLRLIEKLDNFYTDFNAINQTKIVKSLGEGLVGLNKFNTNYFNEITLNEVTKKRFDQVNKATKDLMAVRVGITPQGEIKTGGFLDSFVTDRTLLTELKQSVIQNVTGQQSMASFKQSLKDKIIGTDKVSGGFEKYYKTFAYDVFQQYDRAYGKQMADEFQMNYAIFQGGIINDSREACIEHDNKVYTRDEIANFKYWKDSTGEIPSYISKFPNYDPFTDGFGFNCRHSYSWITRSMAIRLRPELANKPN